MRAAALRAGFDDAAAALGSVLDAEQEPAADVLAEVGARALAPHRRWRRLPRGAYLHGPVGRGKTWLADTLVEQLPDGALRLHAYEAARALHAGVARRSGTPRAMDAAVGALLDGVRLLVLDELHAHDPGDAMLLSRLVRALPRYGAVLVATSNYPPAGLLPDERHHHLVLPLVAAVEQGCTVVEVAGPVDHRAQGHGGTRPGWSSGAWALPGSAAQLAALGLPLPDPADRVRLDVGGRDLRAALADERHVHLAFDDLCGGRTSVGDALELAGRYRCVVLAGVPVLAERPLDERRRFADLVDVLWDRDVRLVVLSRWPSPVAVGGDLGGLTDAERMRSRLLLLGGA